jgi:circadian clock protein KaiC
MTDGRVSTGVRGLDALLAGGFPARRTVLVRGGAGTGKTTLGLQFLMAGVERGEPGVLVAVDQKPRHVVEDAARCGWDLNAAAGRQLLTLLDASPFFTAARGKAIALDARQVATDLAQQARTVKATRMFVDSLTSLVPEGGSATEARDFLRSLFFSLEDNIGCTVLLASHAMEGERGPMAYAESLATGLVDLKLVRDGDQHRRTLFVRKMRGTPTDLTERSFHMTGTGIALDGLG